MTRKDLADLIFPNIKLTVEDYEKMYPERNLDKNAIVSRYAPSPTGFIHIGALLSSFTDSVFAKQTNGVFYLRIEDTDTKRTVENGINTIIDGLKEFNVTFDEGPNSDNTSYGAYGPYIQSERKEIYQAFIKHLIENDKAYPCFCTAEEIEQIRKDEEACKARIGYYGEWAHCRNLSVDEAYEKIKNGESYIIRFKSEGDFNKKIICHDEIRGDIAFPENDIDIVIMKSDGLPTYHFAHLVDDHLMRTTHVIRGDEWLSSLPLHIQLFEAFGYKPLKYCHIAPLCKVDEETGNVRKVSKRKDPEFAMSYYHKEGIPSEAVRLYLANITSSAFESWFLANPTLDIKDFKFEFKKMNKSGALFDVNKLMNISKTYISHLKADDLYERVSKYLKEYDNDFYNVFTKDSTYSTNILNIEREVKKPRKDIGKYSDVFNEINYMYDEYFKPNYENENLDASMYLEYIENVFNENDDKNTWFNNLALFASKYNYASMKDYKENPDNYKGHIGDFCEGLRYIVSGRTQTPDLYEITKLIGKNRLIERINNYKKTVE